MKLFDFYPELAGRAAEERRVLIEHARHKTFRKNGNSAKLVGWLSLIFIAGYFGKVLIDLLLMGSVGQIIAGLISFALIFPLVFYFSSRAYASILKPEVLMMVSR